MTPENINAEICITLKTVHRSISDDISRVNVDARSDLANSLIVDKKILLRNDGRTQYDGTHEAPILRDNEDRTEMQDRNGNIVCDGGVGDVVPKQKKKKRKKKKKKVIETDNHVTLQQRVTFGPVHVREFRRCVGFDGVPYHGGWPLGISNEIIRDYEVSGGIENFEKQKQLELNNRWEQIFGKENESFSLLCLNPLETLYESRQYDHKKRIDIKGLSGTDGKNPLFGPCDEDDRKLLLLRDFSISDSDIETLSNKANCQVVKERFSKRDLRSNSRGMNHPNDFIFPSAFCDEKMIRNELEQIRNNRSIEFTGCSCRKIFFFLPAYVKDIESSGKNAKVKGKKQHRLTERRLKEELRKRGLNAHFESRDDMEIALGKALENERCCQSDHCPCMKNGISCQAGSCSCWHYQHQRNEKSNGKNCLTVEDIKQACGNPHGINVVDFDKIASYRKKFITI